MKPYVIGRMDINPALSTASGGKFEADVEVHTDSASRALGENLGV